MGLKKNRLEQKQANPLNGKQIIAFLGVKKNQISREISHRQKVREWLKSQKINASNIIIFIKKSGAKPSTGPINQRGATNVFLRYNGGGQIEMIL
jgi:hypothetical protein